jgi:hypothetical protein
MLGSYRVATQLVASRVVLSSIELHSKYGVILQNLIQAFAEYYVISNNRREILQGNIELVILHTRI